MVAEKKSDINSIEMKLFFSVLCVKEGGCEVEKQLQKRIHIKIRKEQLYCWFCTNI